MPVRRKKKFNRGYRIMPTLDLGDNIIKNTRALVFKKENGQRHFLLTFEQGENYTLPGGCKDLEDQDLLAAMKRELKEELGLEKADYIITPTNIQRIYENLYNDPTRERFHKNTVMSLFIVECKDERRLKAGKDIESVVWLDEESVRKVLKYREMKEMFELGMSLLKL